MIDVFTLSELRPDRYYRSIGDIDFASLHEDGISHYMIDLDNTLLHRRGGLDQRAVRALREAVDKGYIKEIVILSNTIFGKKKVKRAEEAACDLSLGIGSMPVGLVCLNFFQRKPKPVGFIKALHKLSRNNRSAETVVIIGDQISSDIKGGNAVGLFTILVDPLGAYLWTSWMSLRVFRNRRIKQKLGLRYSDS